MKLELVKNRRSRRNMRKIIRGGLIMAMVGVGVFLAGCYMKTEHKIEAHITIDIRELSNTANQIEDMVRAKKPKGQSLRVPWTPLEVRTKGAAVTLGDLLLMGWKVELAYGEMEIKFMTPAVEKAIADRGARLDSLEELMKQGCLGENNRGYVEYLSCPVCKKDPALKEKAEKLAKEENQDRLTIYQTIIEQNNLPVDTLPLIEKVFSQVQCQKAPAGSYIQQDDGSWIKK